MHRRPALHLAPVLAAIALASILPAARAQTSGGVSIGVVQPGIYGRVDIGTFPAPAVIYPQPMVIVPSPVAVVQRPIYLYVPPGHQKNWAKHCAKYSACGQPVYFVQESWVRGYDDRSHGQQKKHKKHKKNDD